MPGQAKPKETVFSRTALERVVKEVSGFARASPDGFDHLQSTLDALIVKVATEAGDLARADKQTTILLDDIEQALAHQMGRPGSGDPVGIFAALEAASTEDLGQLVNLINAWIEARKAQRDTP